MLRSLPRVVQNLRVSTSQLTSEPAVRFLSDSSDSISNEINLPSSSRVVIIGGGVIGCSVAYHLTKRGVSDVLLLEQAKLTSGTTWHACGLIGQLRGTNTETQMSGVYASKIFEELTRDTGMETGFRKSGSITLARNKDRMSMLKRALAKATTFGIEAEMITPEEANEKFANLIRHDDLEGALWLPNDGTANASDVCMAFASGARLGGAQIAEGIKVTGIMTNRDDSGKKQIVGVETNNGNIDCEIVVNCGGMWAREIGKLAGIPVPLHSCEHFYAVSQPLQPAVSAQLPLMRDPDGFTYFREWSGGIAAGGFEPKSIPCFPDGPPEGFSFSLLEDNLDHFSILLEEAMHRVPALGDVGFSIVNGPESFTVDSHYMVGETNLRKFYVAAGMNSSGIASAGGTGKALADWIADDSPPFDLWPVDVRRFGDWSNNSSFLRDRSSETLGVHYAIRYPNQELESGRGIRRSPLYNRLKEKHACFGSKAGWERPLFFAPNAAEAKVDLSFQRKPKHFKYIQAEHQACRNSVGIFDQSSFAKLLVTGNDASQLMQRLCSNYIPEDDSAAVVYTAMLNSRGGMESDCTVTCLGDNNYMVVTSTSQANRDSHWIRHNIKDDENVSIVDMTSAFSVISIMGPNSRSLLESVSRNTFSNLDFPFATWENIEIEYATCRAVRVTYVGELGWELHVPTEMAAYVYDVLVNAGNQYGARQCGYLAIDSLRIEKGYRAWGHDVGPDETPYEAGLGFAVKLSKDFIGKEALVERKQAGLRKRLLSFVADSPDACILGDEPIYRDGVLAGFVRSAAFGHTIGRPVCMGYIESSGEKITKEFVGSGKYEIEVEGMRYGAAASLSAPYDPKSLRVKGL